MGPLLPLVALGALGCASVSSQRPGVCPDSASLHCMSAPVCSFDKSLGCEVCQCSPPVYNPVAPDQRLTP
ncbi:MAG: hypothetical protein ACLPJH_09270 [Myxococcaceae bacterium]